MERVESGRERESAPILLSVIQPAAALQRRKRYVRHTPVQVTRITQTCPGSGPSHTCPGNMGVCPTFLSLSTCLSPHLSVHGGWSSWSDWSTCSGSCIDDQQRDIIAPFRQRFRSCSNPAPSKGVPPGNFCPGEAKLVLSCSELPNCPGEES